MALSWWGEKGGFQIKGSVTIHTNDEIFRQDVTWMKEIRPHLRFSRLKNTRVSRVFWTCYFCVPGGKYAGNPKRSTISGMMILLFGADPPYSSPDNLNPQKSEDLGYSETSMASGLISSFSESMSHSSTGIGCTGSDTHYADVGRNLIAKYFFRGMLEMGDTFFVKNMKKPATMHVQTFS
jgi:hypothetical protein